MTALKPKQQRVKRGNTLLVGWFLANRYIKRSTPWTTLLIIFVMTLTFLNLVVVSGILVGLIEGVNVGYRKQYSGEVLISAPQTRSYIENTGEIVAIAEASPEIKDFSVRYLTTGSVEANYRDRRRANDLPDRIGAVVAGINPEREEATSNLSRFVIAGEYLSSEDEGEVLVGSGLLQEYALGEPVSNTLENVRVGDRIRVSMNGVTREVRVKGIIKSKVDLISRRLYFTDREFRNITERTNLEANEIALFGKDGIDPVVIKNIFTSSGFEKDALIQTYKEAQPAFVKDITSTFDTLGSIIGSIGLVASSVTIFIVIFVNAVTRRKYIGILQGIGIETKAIEISYILQAIFYALCGIFVGLVLLYGFMKPFLDANPIDFPFSDGILYVEPAGVLIRIFILLTATLIAGFIPARLVTRGNILDSILGR
jgi:ABC-type lipoprotein release transport system permease subunit